MSAGKDKDGNKQRTMGAYETIIHGRPEAPLHIRLDNDYLRIDVYHHNADDAAPGVLTKLDGLEQLLLNIQTQSGRIITMSKDEAKRLDTLGNTLKARFQKLLDKIIALDADAMTDEEKAEVAADFAILEALGADPADPIPVI